MNQNDARVFELKEQIDAKKKTITVVKNDFKTNKVIELRNVKYNLNVLDKDNLLILLSDLVVIKSNLTKEQWSFLKISGFLIQDWIDDVTLELAKKQNQLEMKKLNDLSEELNKLLTSDTQISLKLDAIQNSIL